MRVLGFRVQGSIVNGRRYSPNIEHAYILLSSRVFQKDKSQSQTGLNHQQTHYSTLKWLGIGFGLKQESVFDHILGVYPSGTFLSALGYSRVHLPKD